MAWNVDFPASFFFFLIIIDLGTNSMRKKHSKWILLPVNLLCYDHMVIAGLLAGMSLFCCWVRCPDGPSQGGGVLASRVKGQCLKILSLKKERGLIILAF